MKINKKIIRKVFEKLVNFDDVLSEIRIGNTYCLFHDNRNTKAAKFFYDEDGTIRLYCWSCKRQYTAYDYINLLTKETPEDYLNRKFTEKELLEEVKAVSNDYTLTENESLQMIDEIWLEADEEVGMFLELLYGRQ